MAEWRLDIYLDDLTPEKQKEVCEFYGIENPKDENWNLFPLTSLWKDDGEDEDEDGDEDSKDEEPISNKEDVEGFLECCGEIDDFFTDLQAEQMEQG